MTTAASSSRPVAGFDPLSHWKVHPSVAVRPEPFGALLYHFGTRRLSFLKDRRLLDIISSLDDHLSVLAACVAAGVDPAEQPMFTAALARLAESEMLVPVLIEENHP